MEIVLQSSDPSNDKTPKNQAKDKSTEQLSTNFSKVESQLSGRRKRGRPCRSKIASSTAEEENRGEGNQSANSHEEYEKEVQSNDSDDKTVQQPKKAKRARGTHKKSTDSDLDMLVSKPENQSKPRATKKEPLKVESSPPKTNPKRTRSAKKIVETEESQKKELGERKSKRTCNKDEIFETADIVIPKRTRQAKKNEVVDIEINAKLKGNKNISKSKTTRNVDIETVDEEQQSQVEAANEAQKRTRSTKRDEIKDDQSAAVLKDQENDEPSTKKRGRKRVVKADISSNEDIPVETKVTRATRNTKRVHFYNNTESTADTPATVDVEPKSEIKPKRTRRGKSNKDSDENATSTMPKPTECIEMTTSNEDANVIESLKKSDTSSPSPIAKRTRRRPAVKSDLKK